MNHRDLWSGRWESNPRPIAAKALKLLVDGSHFPTIYLQNRGHFLDRLAVRTAHDVPVNLERRACIGVTKLALSDFGAGTGVEQERRVRMAECMESTPRDPERVEKSPQVYSTTLLEDGGLPLRVTKRRFSGFGFHCARHSFSAETNASGIGRTVSLPSLLLSAPMASGYRWILGRMRPRWFTCGR